MSKKFRSENDKLPALEELCFFGRDSRYASKNDPQIFDFHSFTIFGRGVIVVHTNFGHDFQLKITSRLLVPG